MYVVLGATGHTGAAVAGALLDAGEAVTAVTREREKAAALANRGAVIAEVDVLDVEALRAVFRTGRRAFLLNPPADPSSDRDAEERRTAAAIVAALDGSGLDFAVAQSTYGAQPGHEIGDLGTLYDFEQGLRAQAVPVLIQRVAYLMSNWDVVRESAENEGTLPTPYPADFALPMVAPDDIGRVAADLLRAQRPETGIVHIEGPEPYAANDVAAAFAAVLGRDVTPEVIPRETWVDYFESLGFSPAGARSFAGMTGLTLDQDYQSKNKVLRGGTSITDYIQRLVG